MKTNDGHDILPGDKIFNRWGEPVTVGNYLHENSTSVYTHDPNGDNIQNECPNNLFKSERLAREHHVAWISRRAWEKEQEAASLRNQETLYRERIIELEKIEERERQAKEAEEDEN